MAEVKNGYLQFYNYGGGKQRDLFICFDSLDAEINNDIRQGCSQDVEIVLGENLLHLVSFSKKLPTL